MKALKDNSISCRLKRKHGIKRAREHKRKTSISFTKPHTLSNSWCGFGLHVDLFDFLLFAQVPPNFKFVRLHCSTATKIIN